jgi:hypothetical protein
MQFQFGIPAGAQGDPGPAGSVPITVSPTPPANPNTNDLWIDTSSDPSPASGTWTRIALDPAVARPAGEGSTLIPIPAGYTQLRIYCLMRQDTNTFSTTARIRFGVQGGSVDTSFTYYWLYNGSDINAGSPWIAFNQNDSSISDGLWVAGAGQPPASTIIDVPFYSVAAAPRVLFTSQYLDTSQDPADIFLYTGTGILAGAMGPITSIEIESGGDVFDSITQFDLMAI